MGCTSSNVKEVSNEFISEISNLLTAENIEKASTLILEADQMYDQYSKDGKVRLDSLVKLVLEASKVNRQDAAQPLQH